MDELIDKLIAFRDEKRMLENQLKEAQNECEKLKDIAYYNEEKYRKCNLEKQRLVRECNKWTTDYLRMKNDCGAIASKYDSLSKELSTLSLEKEKLKAENLKLMSESKRKLYSFSAKKEEMITVRELVEQLIIYAEKENKGVAREIRIALDKKMANGFIPKDVLTYEWKERLDSLGREKKAPIQNIFNIIAVRRNFTIK